MSRERRDIHTSDPDKRVRIMCFANHRYTTTQNGLCATKYCLTKIPRNIQPAADRATNFTSSACLLQSHVPSIGHMAQRTRVAGHWQQQSLSGAHREGYATVFSDNDTRPKIFQLLAQLLSPEPSGTVKSRDCPGPTVPLSAVMLQTWPFRREGRVYPFHLSSGGRRTILQSCRGIQRCSTLFPSYT